MKRTPMLLLPLLFLFLLAACQAGEDGVFLPQSAQVVGNFSPQQRETLAQMLEGELGLPRDRQTIQTKEESP